MDLQKRTIFYKCYENILTRIKNLAKKLKFYHKLEESKNDPQKTRNILRPILPPAPLPPLLLL